MKAPARKGWRNHLRLAALLIFLAPTPVACTVNNSGSCVAQGSNNSVTCDQPTSGAAASAEASGSVGAPSGNSATPQASSQATASQAAPSYQQIPFSALCQNGLTNNFYDSCPGGDFSAELGGQAYSFTADVFVNGYQSVVTFTNATCKSLSLRLGILPPGQGADPYPPDLTITVSVVQGSLPEKSVVVPLNQLVKMSVRLAGGTWDIDARSNMTGQFAWPLLMDGSAMCSTSTGVSND